MKLAEELAVFMNEQFKSELRALTEGAQQSYGGGIQFFGNSPPRLDLYGALRFANGFLLGKGQGLIRLVVQGGDNNRFESCS